MLSYPWRTWREQLSRSMRKGLRARRRLAEVGKFLRPMLERLEERTLLSTVIASSFDGLTGAQTGGYPPDSQGAVGPSSYVETVNQTVAIWNKTTGQQTTTQGGNPNQEDLATFWSDGGLKTVDQVHNNVPAGTVHYSDPVVTYDNLNGRFIIGDQDISDPENKGSDGKTYGNGASVFDIAVSRSSTPTTLTTKDWYFYQVDTTEPDGNGKNFWSDYPGNLGYNADALVFSLNQFRITAPGTVTEDHAAVFSVNMSNLASNGSLQSTKVDTPQGVYGIRPTAMHDATAGGPMWLLTDHDANGTRGLYTLQLTNLLNNPNLGSVTAVAGEPVKAFMAPVALQQPAGGPALASNIDMGILQAAELNNQLVACETVSTAANEDDARWYRVDVSGAPTLKDQGDVSGGTNVYNAYPGIDINSQGDIGMSFLQTGTGANQFESVYVTGRTPTDPAGTMADPVLVQAGAAVFKDNHGNRAGDLSGINVDADGSFWAVNEFATQGTYDNGNWGQTIAHFTVGPAADLSVVAVGPATVNPGTTVTYTIAVTNNGPSNAQNVTVTNTLPAGFVLSSMTAVNTNPDNFTPTGSNTVMATTMGAGNTDVFQVVATAPNTLTAGSQVSDTATVSDSSPPDPILSNNISTTTATVEIDADLSVVTVGPPTITAGTTVTYTITATNNGPNDAANVQITNTLPSGFILSSITAVNTNPDNFVPTGSNTVRAAIMGAGHTDVFQVVAMALSSLTAADSPKTDTATISSSTTDPVSANNTSTTSANIVTSADLAIVKTTTEAVVTAGTDLTYTITLTNNGPSDAQAVVVSDLLPATVAVKSPLTQTSGPDKFTFANSTTTNPTVVGAGNTDTFTLVVHALSSDADGSTITNTAKVASPTDPNLANNTSSVNTAVITSADLSVTAVGPPPQNEGDIFTYTLTLHNGGPSDAQNVVLTDTVPAGLAMLSLTPNAGNPDSFTQSISGNTLTETAKGPIAAGNTDTFTLKVQAVEDGKLTDTVSASTTTPDSTPGNNTSRATTAVGEPGLFLTGGASFSPQEFAALSNVTLATFTHAQGVEPGGDFTAKVDWGDGTTSAATVSQSGLTYSVVGSHTYNHEGNYSIKVSVSEDGGAAASTTSSATVGEAGLPPGAPTGKLADFINETLDDAFHQQPTAAQISTVEMAMLALEFQFANNLMGQGNALQAFLEAYVLGQAEFGLYVGVLSGNGDSLAASVNDMVGAFLLQAVDIGAAGGTQ